MKIRLLKSKVAHRLFILLIVSMLLPVILFAIPSFNFITEKLFINLQNRLQQSAIDLGLDLEERLNFIASEMMIIASNTNTLEKLRDISNNSIQKDRLTKWFSSLSISKPTTKPIHLLTPMESIPSLDESQIAKLVKGKPILLEKLNINNSKLYIYQLLAPTHPEKGMLVGIINPKYFWQIEESLPTIPATGCILNKDLAPIACSNINKLNNILKFKTKLIGIKAGHFEEVYDKVNYFYHFWSNFSEKTIIQPNWIVIISAPASYAFSQISQYLLAFPLFLLFAFLIVSILSIKQIRRVIMPLEQLREGTKNISKKNFHASVNIDSGDEFEDLSKSFNLMSSRLGKQFNALETMARIDRMILSTLDMDHIVEIILIRMIHAVSCDSISLYIASESNPRVGDIYFRKEKLSTKIDNIETEISKEDYLLLSYNRSSMIIKQNTPIPSYIKSIKGSMVCFLLLPIFLENKLSAIIMLGYLESQKHSKDDVKQSRDLADRVAVALSNAAWEDKLYHQAHYDNLTNLPNRLLFQDRLQHALQRANRNKSRVALMFLDLDHFKTLNDSFGHSAGDVFLKEISNRITNCLRSVDTVSRLGGDEFTIIIPDLEQRDDLIATVANIADKILDKTSEPTEIGNNKVTLSVSIGIAIYPNDANTTTDLLKAADLALYYAKNEGKSHYQFYSEDIDAHSKSILKLETDFKRALKANEFELHYQPRFSIPSQKILGAEALLRWNNNKNQQIPPSTFIPIAENNGLILTLGHWVLRRACKTCKQLHDLGYKDLRIAVNISPYQFKDNQIIEHVTGAINESGLDPKFLELEITEGALMTDSKAAIKKLQILHDMNICLSIDDFGIGYSSLNYLKKFPIHLLKIDQSFVKNIHLDKDNAAIVSAIINLAENLGLDVVAEGVETYEELAFLQSKQCREIQGFLFSKALEYHDLLRFMETFKPHPQIREIP